MATDAGDDLPFGIQNNHVGARAFLRNIERRFKARFSEDPSLVVVASWNLFLGDPYGVGLAHEERQMLCWA
jgi:hypothetical protein